MQSCLLLPIFWPSKVLITQVVTFKAGNQIQVFNLDQKQKIKGYQLNDSVVFWKWLTPNVIGMVTQTAVYHWIVDGNFF